MSKAREILLKYRQHIVDADNPANMVGKLTLDEALQKLRELVLSQKRQIKNSLNAQQSFECIGANRMIDKISALLGGE